MSKKQNVESPLGHAAGRDIEISAAPDVAVQAISGGTNIFGIRGNVHVQIGAVPKARVNNIIRPGIEHINADQRRALTDLCDEWVTLHNSIKKTPLHKGSAWTRINKAAGSTSYHLILAAKFEVARAYVSKQIAMLRGMASAPTKDLNWRNQRIGAIKVRSKNQLGDPDAYKAYIRKNFKAESLTDLATDQLQKTYVYIMGKKV